MTDLQTVAKGCGLSEARTLLQSGNLIFEAKAKSASALEKQLEDALLRELELQTPVMVRSADEWRAALEANPFPKQAKSDPAHLVLMPLKAKVEKGALASLTAAIVGREQAALVGRELYLLYPDGIGRSKLTSAVVEKKLGGVAGTGRNWNTALKIAALLEA